MQEFHVRGKIKTLKKKNHKVRPFNLFDACLNNWIS